jgi:flagellar assembly factor FliW
MISVEKIITSNFGEMDYDPEKVIHFPTGLPGYPDDNNFVLLDMEETNDTFFWLQSVDDGEVCFPMMDVYKIIPEYDPHVDPEELADLGEIEGISLEIYNIAVIPEDISLARVNLRAPVIINVATRRGKQIVCSNEEYAVRHMIMEQLKAVVQGVVQC